MLMLQAKIDIKSREVWTQPNNIVAPIGKHLFDIVYRTKNPQIITMIIVFKS